MSVELPELEPLEPPELPEPMPLPLLGVGELLGDVLELPPLLPLVPPAAPEPDLLKCASHSEREIWPSLFVSTDEKLGAELLLELPLEPPDVALPPEAALPPLDAPDEPLDVDPPELEPEAAGEDDDLSLLVPLEEELCARATLDSANSAAAVAALSILRFSIGDSSVGVKGNTASC